MGKRILVIEDTPLSMTLMTQFLQAFGYEVLEATNAAQGLALALAGRPDLIVSDIGLPDEDGLKLAQRFKADPHLCTIPLVGVSGCAREEDFRLARECGFDHYVAKPVDFAILLELTRALLVAPAPARPWGAQPRVGCDPVN